MKICPLCKKKSIECQCKHPSQMDLVIQREALKDVMQNYNALNISNDECWNQLNAILWPNPLAKPKRA